MRTVGTTFPLPKRSASSATAESSPGVKTVPAGTTRPEKSSVPRLRRKPIFFTRAMSS